jgi:putative ABC transport system permease protein
MLRLTIKNLAANRVRFALTTFAVVLAVSFVVSSFVLTDGLRSSFNSLSGEIVAGTDYEIRPTTEFGEPEPLPESMLDEVRAVDGVAAAAPVVGAEQTIRPINGDGVEIPVNGPPQIAFGWVDEPRLSSFTVVEGEAPLEPDQFTMGVDAAATHGFEVGETYEVLTPTGRTSLTLSGLTSFGADNTTLGATLMQFDIDALQEMIGSDGYNAIAVALDGGADRAAVEAGLVEAAPTAEVIDQATLESEARADFNSAIDILGNVLLGFAGISLFVSIFIIYNTFAIVLGQRTRELALLRTVGADPRQLQRSVLGEAFLIGLLASGIGIAGGVGVAAGLKAVFAAIGADLPATAIIVSGRTIAVAFLVGVVVTMISAIGPARKASRVPAIAALRDGAAAGGASARTRFTIGAALVAVGVGAGAFGLFAAATTSSIVLMLAVGAIGVFVGVTMLSPVVVGPLTAVLGWPTSRLAGVSGTLAKQNAGRNPQRTATTAAALMIGLALVSMVLTVGESVKAQLRSTLDSSVAADYIVVDEAEFPAGVADDIAATDIDGEPIVGTITTFRYDEAKIDDGQVVEVVGTDLAAATTLFDFDISDGVGSDPAIADPVLVARAEADARGLEVGDTVPAELGSGASAELTVIGIFDDDFVIEEPYAIDRSTWDELGANPSDQWLSFTLVEGVSIEEADEALAPIQAANPQISIDTANDFVRNAEAQIDSLLTVVNAMVALAVVIALIGIANTLALSVFERTRELGLLRAVGMTRRQLRRMVRLEAGLVALFGAVLGVTVGVLFGWAAVAALPSSITSTLAVPTTRILLLVAVAGAAGLVAAWGPARRAGKLDVLDAVAS